MKKKLYFAGDLFDHKHLIGNALVAYSIAFQSDGEFWPFLPQDYEQTDNRAVQIRNQDLAMILESDLALFNFDGTDLDSGTVVEFMFAKFIDLPSVLLRTDFRNAGDGLKDGDPWNLMLTGYKRTKNLIINSMKEYQDELKKDKTREREEQGIFNIVGYYTDNLAKKIIKEFDNLLSEENLNSFNSFNLLSKYVNAIDMAGADFKIFLKNRWKVDDNMFESYLKELIDSKRLKGIYK